MNLINSLSAISVYVGGVTVCR